MKRVRTGKSKSVAPKAAARSLSSAAAKRAPIFRNGAIQAVRLPREPTEPRFWRDDTLPFIEVRSIHNGRKISYAKHAHETFSIGIVANGRCTYSNGKTLKRIGAGSVVVINRGCATGAQSRTGRIVPGHRGLMRAAEFIKDNYTRSLKLDEICSAANLLPSYLIRAFKNEYGMTPHAYLVNCRMDCAGAAFRRVNTHSLARSIFFTF
jgi:hypothetical protein